MGVNHRTCALLVATAAWLSACGGAAPETPADTVRRFLAAMDRGAADAGRLREAYDLLDAQAQGALRERAHKAETLTGRAFQPWEMLAQGRFRLRFAPRSPHGMRERVTGAEAVVVVTGASGEHADVPLVHEAGRWRIRLPIPPTGGPDARPL